MCHAFKSEPARFQQPYPIRPIGKGEPELLMVNKFETELLRATEAEFLAALKLRHPRLFEQSDAERDAALQRWQLSAKRNPPPGLKRHVSMRRAFADAERLVQTGIPLDDALKQAIASHGIEYPPKYKNDEKTWLRRIRTQYKDIPAHAHVLLDVEVSYGFRHAQDAMIEMLPDIISAIFITSNRATRRKIIAFVF